MSRQPEGRHQGVGSYSVFRFPESEKTSGKSSEQKASWVSLTPKLKRADEQSSSLKPYVRTSFSEPSIKSGEVEPVKAEKTEEHLSKSLAESSVEIKVEKNAEAHSPVLKDDAIESATIQKVLDDMFQKGLEQGREEGLAQQLHSVREEARQGGYSEGQQEGIRLGMQQGLAQAEQELQSRYAVLDQLTGEVNEQKKVLDDQQIVLVSRLLEKLLQEILRVELKHSPEQIEAVVRESVAMLDAGEQEVLRVYLHPDDMAWISGLADSGQFMVRFVEDRQVLPGGCRVEGLQGDVDGTLETRLAAGIEHIRTLLLNEEFGKELNEEHAPQQAVSALVNEFAVSFRASRSGGADELADKRPVPVTANREPVAVAPSFSFDPDSVSGLGAWDSLGQ